MATWQILRLYSVYPTLHTYSTLVANHYCRHSHPQNRQIKHSKGCLRTVSTGKLHTCMVMQSSSIVLCSQIWYIWYRHQDHQVCPNHPKKVATNRLNWYLMNNSHLYTKLDSPEEGPVCKQHTHPASKIYILGESSLGDIEYFTTKLWSGCCISWQPTPSRFIGTKPITTPP